MRHNPTLVSQVDTTSSAWLPRAPAFSGDPGSCEPFGPPTKVQGDLVMAEQPKPQPKPERPENDPREGARAALQTSMDRRY